VHSFSLKLYQKSFSGRTFVTFGIDQMTRLQIDWAIEAYTIFLQTGLR